MAGILRKSNAGIGHFPQVLSKDPKVRGKRLPIQGSLYVLWSKDPLPKVVGMVMSLGILDNRCKVSYWEAIRRS